VHRGGGRGSRGEARGQVIRRPDSAALVEARGERRAARVAGLAEDAELNEVKKKWLKQHTARRRCGR
jgi:hypothetical protein